MTEALGDLARRSWAEYRTSADIAEATRQKAMVLVEAYTADRLAEGAKAATIAAEIGCGAKTIEKTDALRKHLAAAEQRRSARDRAEAEEQERDKREAKAFIKAHPTFSAQIYRDGGYILPVWSLRDV